MARVRQHHLDKFAVAYQKDGDEHWLETHMSEGAAIHARDVVNAHEEENGRTAKFYHVRIGEKVS